MAKLRVLASGSTPSARSQKRGKLFESLMTDVFRRFGYTFNGTASTNYSGMEIDIDGIHTATNLPLYAECKCYESEVDSPKLQAFFGKYVALWMKDNRAHGIFVAIPGINPHAKGFYRDNCEANPKLTLRLYQEDEVLQALIDSGKLSHPSTVPKCIPLDVGSAGEQLTLSTELGIFVVQFIIPTGSAIASHFALFDARGQFLTDRGSIETLIDLEPELKAFEFVSLGPEPLITPARSAEVPETIVEVKGSSSCFEFQFPASPEHFVGRTNLRGEVKDFVADVVARRTAARGLLFEANSGWGKSSAVLSCAEHLRGVGHYSVAIDSRSASSSQFILRVVQHTVQALLVQGISLNGADSQISGFDSAAEILVKIGQELARRGKLLVIFLDQFENLFFLPDAFKRIRDLFLKVSNAETNVVFGFCWKTDLVGLTNEFPYQLRDSIRTVSRVVQLEKFTEAETSELLNKLSAEIGAPLRKDLRFFLSEFSQGYPWLLKKLCAHVKSQREAGTPQIAIANGLLNVEQLFQEDLNGLSLQQEEALRRIAKLAPIAIADLGDELSPTVLHSLIDRRLVVRIGTKLDIYWDIFRDFLNTGRVPAQEQYIPRLGTRSVYRACKILADAGKAISVQELATRAKVSSQSFYNVAHEFRMLGLATISGELVSLNPALAAAADFQAAFRAYLSDKLKRNRLVLLMLDKLTVEPDLSVEQIGQFLMSSCPYISASASSWEDYSDIFCDWLDAGDLAIHDRRGKRLRRYQPGTEIRERHFSRLTRRGGTSVLQVHYGPVAAVAKALAQILHGGKFAWPQMGPSTRQKALLVLEDFGYITRKSGSITVLLTLKPFGQPDFDVPKALGDAALKIASFREFIGILSNDTGKKKSHLELGRLLMVGMNSEWSDGTAQTTSKILMDWARHTGLARGPYAKFVQRSASEAGFTAQAPLL